MSEAAPAHPAVIEDQTPPPEQPDDPPDVEAVEPSRLTRALHWAQQGTTPEVSQGRWLRRLAGQAQDRLDDRLTDEQIDDIAMVAALVHAEALSEGAELARRNVRRSRVLVFAGTVVGAAIGAALVQVVLATLGA